MMKTQILIIQVSKTYPSSSHYRIWVFGDPTDHHSTNGHTLCSKKHPPFPTSPQGKVISINRKCRYLQIRCSFEDQTTCNSDFTDLAGKGCWGAMHGGLQVSTYLIGIHIVQMIFDRYQDWIIPKCRTAYVFKKIHYEKETLLARMTRNK